MRHHFFTAAILIAALACYSVGLAGGGFFLLFLGGGLELWFWMRAMRSPKRLPGINPSVKI